MDLNTGLSAHLEEIIQIRRHIHMYPELSEEETETAGYIASVLEKYQIPFRRTETGNGIVAQIGNPGNKCVGLRADIDALPVTEETGLPYACLLYTSGTAGTKEMPSCLQELNF